MLQTLEWFACDEFLEDSLQPKVLESLTKKKKKKNPEQEIL